MRPGNCQVGPIGEEHLLALSGATANFTDHDVTDLLIELETEIYVRGHVDPVGACVSSRSWSSTTSETRTG